MYPQNCVSSNQFASFFTQKIKRIPDMFLASTTIVAPPTDLSPNLSHFYEVSENDVLKIIKNSPTKSCLLDPVPTFLLKDCVYFTPIHYKTCQFVFGRRCFPPPLLIKKASLPNEDLKHYRPVSGLCFMSKLVERVVVKQLMQHINSNNLDNPHQ